MQTKFMSIEGLRAWMAWWVVVVHCYDIVGRGLLPAGMEKLATRSDAAVSVFMIVSGFVIAHLLLRGPVGYGSFVLRRFFRIFPIYLVCLLFAIAVHAVWHETWLNLAWPPGGSAVRMQVQSVVEQSWWTRLLLHLTMLQGLVPEGWLRHVTASFLTPTWSLSLEWQFYLVAPLLFVLLRQGLSVFAVTCAVLMAGGIAAHAGVFGHYAMPSMLLLSINYFLVGIASRMLLDAPIAPRIRAGAFLLLGVTVMLFVQQMVALIWTVFFTFVLVENGKLQHSRAVDALMHAVATNRFIGHLGRISYSTYLVHYPIFVLAMILFPGTAQLDKWQMLGFLAALLPVVLLASMLLYRFVEQPFIRLGAKLAPQARRAPSVTAGEALPAGG